VLGRAPGRRQPTAGPRRARPPFVARAEAVGRKASPAVRGSDGLCRGAARR